MTKLSLSHTNSNPLDTFFSEGEVASPATAPEVAQSGVITSVDNVSTQNENTELSKDTTRIGTEAQHSQDANPLLNALLTRDPNDSTQEPLYSQHEEASHALFDDDESPSTSNKLTVPSHLLDKPVAAIRTVNTLITSTIPNISHAAPSSNWYGKPQYASMSLIDHAQTFRRSCRNGSFDGVTAGTCPGLMQCNLVVLPKQYAFDFLLFCQRNPKACPLIDVGDVGSCQPSQAVVAHPEDVDLRTDLPLYTIWKDGEVAETVVNCVDQWPIDAVAFLIGCSFTFDEALMKADVSLRSVDQGKNVPMYKTNIPCRPAGCFMGNMVVSMKPIKATDVAKEVVITSNFPHCHGAPLCIGCPQSIGIVDTSKPEYGDPVEIMEDELPVFHACGVTPQNVIAQSKIPFAITHAPGHMFVTDLPSEYNSATM